MPSIAGFTFMFLHILIAKWIKMRLKQSHGRCPQLHWQAQAESSQTGMKRIIGGESGTAAEIGRIRKRGESRRQ